MVISSVLKLLLLLNQTILHRCSKVVNQFRENKSGLQTITEGNSSIIRGKKQNNRNTGVQQKQMYIHRNVLFDYNCHIPDWVH